MAIFNNYCDITRGYGYLEIAENKGDTKINSSASKASKVRCV